MPKRIQRSRATPTSAQEIVLRALSEEFALATWQIAAVEARRGTQRSPPGGSVYFVMHIGILQTSEAPNLDGELCVVYQNETHCAVWVRPLAEFLDGRFEKIIG